MEILLRALAEAKKAARLAEKEAATGLILQ